MSGWVTVCDPKSNPAAEIARTFGRTPKAIYRRLDRVREMLLDCVERGIAQAAHRIS